MQTFKDALDAYEREVTPTKRSAETEHYRIAELRRSTLAGIRLDALRRGDIRAWRDARVCTNSTTNRLLALISVTLRHALAEHDVGPGRAVTIDLGRAENPARDVRPTEKEFNRIVALLPLWASRWARFARETAMRRGEIARARWDEINFERRTLTITKAKNGHGRIVPLSSTAIAILKSLPRGGDTLFGMKADSYTQAWIRARDSAGLHHVRGHDVRAMAASEIVEKVGIANLKAIGGWRSQAVMRYLRGDDPTKLAAALG